MKTKKPTRAEKKKKDTGYKQLQRSHDHNFKKWGEYMKRANLAERKVEKLKSLLLLTDSAVSSVVVGELSVTQWNEFIKAFPDEAAATVEGDKNHD